MNSSSDTGLLLKAERYNQRLFSTSQTKIRALVVDDERLARVELKRLLSKYADVEIVGEAEDADEALHSIATLQPDVVFLDIQMPEKDAFSMLAELETEPPVIFTTAFDAFALKAYAFNVLDYLVKPIDPERLERTMMKVRDLKRILDEKSKSVTAQEFLSDTLTEEESFGEETLEASDTQKLGEGSRLFVKDGERYYFITVSDIRVVESEGNYSRVYFGKQSVLLPRSLSYLEERLDRQMFFRASRKHIINLNAIADIESWYQGSLMVKMVCGMGIEMSRRQALRFKDLMMI